MGPAKILIHGATNLRRWRSGIFVVAVDMIGYGYSDKPDLTYTIEENSEFLLALLNTLRIKQTNIIAMGSGATYALDFMVHYPDRVHRAICIAPRRRHGQHAAAAALDAVLHIWLAWQSAVQRKKIQLHDQQLYV